MNLKVKMLDGEIWYGGSVAEAMKTHLIKKQNLIMICLLAVIKQCLCIG